LHGGGGEREKNESARLVVVYLFSNAKASAERRVEMSADKEGSVQKVASLREQGNEAFKTKDYDTAVSLYTKALKESTTVESRGETHLLLANRSASYLMKGKPDLAAADARNAIEADPSYVKGYFRLARALEATGDFNKAIDTVERGIATDKGLYARDQSNRKQYATLRKLGKKLWKKLTFKPFSSYMFEDEMKGKRPITRVYIYLDGIGNIPRSNITCVFEQKSLDLKIRDLDGVNYRLCEPELWGSIRPEKCRVVVKKNKLTLELTKADLERKWTKLGYT